MKLSYNIRFSIWKTHEIEGEGRRTYIADLEGPGFDPSVARKQETKVKENQLHKYKCQ